MLFSDDKFCKFWPNILIWLRYIDDVMMLWSGSVEELSEFMTALGKNSLLYNLMKSYSIFRYSGFDTRGRED